MPKPVVLIGGAPGAGKTTLGSALAVRLGVNSLTIDDLVTAAVAITTPETHPGLHALRRLPYIEYFTDSSVEQLISDATLRHEAVFPMVKNVIHKYVTQGSGIVIDGWHLRPEWVAKLVLKNVHSYWLVVDEHVLETRERNNYDFFTGVHREKLLENFLARSFWYNTLIKEQATSLEMNVLYQTGNVSVDELCQHIIDDFG